MKEKQLGLNSEFTVFAIKCCIGIFTILIIMALLLLGHLILKNVDTEEAKVYYESDDSCQLSFGMGLSFAIILGVILAALGLIFQDKLMGKEDKK